MKKIGFFVIIMTTIFSLKSVGTRSGKEYCVDSPQNPQKVLISTPDIETVNSIHQVDIRNFLQEQKLHSPTAPNQQPQDTYCTDCADYEKYFPFQSLEIMCKALKKVHLFLHFTANICKNI